MGYEAAGMRRSLLVFATVAAFGCATGPPAIPFCPRMAELPVATPECLAEPDAQRVVAELGTFIEEAAGDLLFRVAFDEAASVESICAQRPANDDIDIDIDGWTPRARLAGRSGEILSISPGPSCLAGTRLDFNRMDAKFAEIEGIAERCRREGLVRYGSCVEQEQIQRGEIWMLGLGRVFVKSPTGSKRRTAILGCSQNLTPISRSTFGADITHIVVDPNEITDCLRGHGWKLFF